MANLSFRKTLVLHMAAVVSFTMAVVGVYTYAQMSRDAEEAGRRVMRQTTALVDKRIGNLLHLAESQARILADLSSDTRPGALDQFSQTLVKVLRSNDTLGTAAVTLEATGETLSLDQSPGGGLQLTHWRIGGIGKERRVSVPFGSASLDRGTEVGWPTDPRLDPAYVRCKAKGRTAWTETRVGPAAMGDRPGVTVATPVVDDQGIFKGAVSVTLTLDDLSRFLAGARVSDRGTAFLVEFRGGDARVIAYPTASRLLVADDGHQRLATLKELDDPVVSKVVAALASPSGLKGDRPEVSVNGVRYLVGLKVVEGEEVPAWTLCVVSPADDFLAGTRQTAVFFISLACLAVAVGAGASFLLSRRISQPMVALVEEADRIQSLDLTAPPIPATSIREVDELSQAMERMKSSMRSLEKLVPTEYARWLISSGQEAKLGGERRHITTYFADIIGFTALSRDLPPEELVDVLTEYLDVLSAEVLRHGGTVDKFNGDDVMAFWGAPTITTDHAVAACRAAYSSLSSIDSLHVEWRDHGRPLLRASFGIATGDVVVGNVGSRQRMNYTVIGDSVNMASRLQGLNKFYQTNILIGRGTYEEAGEAVVARHVDRVAVFGRDDPEDVYELMAMAEQATDLDHKLAALHQEAMAAYLGRDWDGALAAWEKVLHYLPHDGPARVLLNRTLAYKERPPGKLWDGSTQMMAK
ncbi:MAG: adenylate/guanylate cyclase domain-containing protein [Fimbriimonadaceae bacterium]|nr:adenylate/guanylate cyclase domain-containing protein [Fimbriimonadaceae bacterium]